MRKEKTKKKITGLDDERGIQQRRSSTSRNMKPLEVWTCQRAENLKKKSSKIPKITTQQQWYRRRRRRLADQQKSAAAPTNCRRRRRCAVGARLYFQVTVIVLFIKHDPQEPYTVAHCVGALRKLSANE